MPTILFADPHILGDTFGGAEVQLWILAAGFSNAGWTVHYVTDAALVEDTRDGVSLHSLAGYKSSAKHKEMFFSCLSQIQPDVIYQRGRKSYTGLVGEYAENTCTPFIFAASMDIDCQRFKEIGRVIRQPKGLISTLRILPHRYKQDISSLKGMRQATLVLAQSKIQQELFKKNLEIKSRVFRNLHPVPESDSIEKGKPLVILWLASVKQWKRPEVFIQLAESLKVLDCQFILAGRLADRSQYEKQLYSYGRTNPNFRYIENIGLDESNELIAKADIFINTSDPFEGFPNTFIQSWLRSTVTLSLNVDPDSLITSHNLGMLCGSLPVMRNELRHLIENDSLRWEMGQKARSFAIKTFGFTENFPAMVNLADGLVKRS